MNCDELREKDVGLISLRNSNSESQSITSPSLPLRSVVKNRNVVVLGERSIHQAIQKLERRLNVSKRKVRKKKSLTELGLKEALILKKFKISSSSLSSQDIRNGNSLN